MSTKRIKSALVSVFYKDGLDEIIKLLHADGVQLISTGAIKDIKEARKIIAEGENLTCYTPTENEKWEEAYKRFKDIIK